jgi:hypothetical protein
MTHVLRGTASLAALAPRLAGIQLTACAQSRVEGNRVHGLGPDGLPVRSADAIAILGLHEHASVVGNLVDRPSTLDRDRASQWRALRILASAASVSADGGRATAFSDTVGRLMLARVSNFEAIITESNVFFRTLPTEFALVRGNRLSASGAAPAVEISSSGQVQMLDNRSSLVPPVKIPVVVVRAQKIIFNANSVEADRGEQDVVRLEFFNQQSKQPPVTVLGNIVSGLIRINGAVLPDPWKTLNVQSA